MKEQNENNQYGSHYNISYNCDDNFEFESGQPNIVEKAMKEFEEI